jgi:hypothetical protein
VTVTAINAVVAAVMFMRELYGLLSLCPLPRVPRRAIDLGQHPDGCDENENGAEDAQPGKKISAMVENLGHRRTLSSNYL